MCENTASYFGENRSTSPVARCDYLGCDHRVRDRAAVPWLAAPERATRRAAPRPDARTAAASDRIAGLARMGERVARRRRASPLALRRFQGARSGDNTVRRSQHHGEWLGGRPWASARRGRARARARVVVEHRRALPRDVDRRLARTGGAPSPRRRGSDAHAAVRALTAPHARRVSHRRDVARPRVAWPRRDRPLAGPSAGPQLSEARSACPERVTGIEPVPQLRKRC